jgi:hypothetical protein
VALTKSDHVLLTFHCLGAPNSSFEYATLKKKVSPKFLAELRTRSPSYPFPILSESGLVFLVRPNNFGFEIP